MCDLNCKCRYNPDNRKRFNKKDRTTTKSFSSFKSLQTDCLLLRKYQKITSMSICENCFEFYILEYQSVSLRLVQVFLLEVIVAYGYAAMT